jgi:hypothetical protein
MFAMPGVVGIPDPATEIRFRDVDQFRQDSETVTVTSNSSACERPPRGKGNWPGKTTALGCDPGQWRRPRARVAPLAGINHRHWV